MKGNRELRSFSLASVQKEDGCPTKFNASSRFVGATPVSAAKKAFSRLCNLKRVKGKCTFFVTVMDTTNGHPRKGKKYTYKVDRRKLAKPIVLQKGTNSEYKIKYSVKAHKATERTQPKRKCAKTSGPMKETAPRKNKQEEKKLRKKTQKMRASANNKKNNAKTLLNRLRMN